MTQTNKVAPPEFTPEACYLPLKGRNILITTAMAGELRELEDFCKNELPTATTLLTGIGKVNAAVSLARYFYKTPAKYLPDLVLNVGCAGCNDANLLTEIVQCSRWYNGDFDDLRSESNEHADRICYISKDKKVTGWDLKNAYPCITTDHFVQNPRDARELREYCDEEGSVIFDMESFAEAEVCKRFEIEFMSVKIISDTTSKLGYKKFWTADNPRPTMADAVRKVLFNK